MYEELVRRLEAAPAKDYSVREAENLADEVLKIYGHVGKSAPTPIVKIAHALGFETFKVSNIPEDISGNIFIGGTTKSDYNVNTDKVIVVGEKEILPHQRFIIAHELAHYFMDYIGNCAYADHAVKFSQTYPKKRHESKEEIRADRFAAELLMPKRVFLSEYVSALERSDFHLEYTIPYLANLFNVKETCVRRRILEVMENA